MSPILRSGTPLAHMFGSRSSNDTAPFFAAAQRASWGSPNDILTILMLIGGDIVQRAIAQLAGSGPGPFVPVAFSFGWVSYAVMALTGALGTGRLMPEPECDALLVNVKSGYARDNGSWILSRLLRDHESTDHNKFIVRFYNVNGVGAPARDWVYKLGVATIMLQLLIAIIPWALHENWLVLVVTVGGTVLALVNGGLRQWHAEKFAGRAVAKGKRDVVCLTRGNGSRFAMVFVSNGVGLRLEDLAGVRKRSGMGTAAATATLTILWIVLLLVVEGVDGDAWYMLAVGGLGMAQNVLAAGARRSEAALGFDVTEAGAAIDEAKVMKGLEAAEVREPGLGIVLLDIFFPGGLRKEEEQYWKDMKNTRVEREREACQKTELDLVESSSSQESWREGSSKEAHNQ